MVKKLLIPIVTYLSIFKLSQSFDINCNFSTSHNIILNYTYICGVQNLLNITSRQLVQIKSAIGVHEPHKSDDDVTVFYAAGKNTQYIPKGIEFFFKNIKRIAIHTGRLKEIRQEDFKPFPKLTELCLADNDIKTLDEGLFIHNPELTLIYLSDNKIFSVGKNVFDGLSKLSHLYLNLNRCIDLKAVNNLTAVKELVRYVKEVCKCSSFWTFMINDNENSSDDESMTKIDELMDRLSFCEASKERKYLKIEEMVRNISIKDIKGQQAIHNYILITIGQIIFIAFGQTIVMVLLYRKYISCF